MFAGWDVLVHVYNHICTCLFHFNFFFAFFSWLTLHLSMYMYNSLPVLSHFCLKAWWLVYYVTLSIVLFLLSPSCLLVFHHFCPFFFLWQSHSFVNLCVCVSPCISSLFSVSPSVCVSLYMVSFFLSFTLCVVHFFFVYACVLPCISCLFFLCHPLCVCLYVWSLFLSFTLCVVHFFFGYACVLPCISSLFLCQLLCVCVCVCICCSIYGIFYSLSPWSLSSFSLYLCQPAYPILFSVAPCVVAPLFLCDPAHIIPVFFFFFFFESPGCLFFFFLFLLLCVYMLPCITLFSVTFVWWPVFLFSLNLTLCIDLFSMSPYIAAFLSMYL